MSAVSAASASSLACPWRPVGSRRALAGRRASVRGATRHRSCGTTPARRPTVRAAPRVSARRSCSAAAGCRQVAGDVIEQAFGAQREEMPAEHAVELRAEFSADTFQRPWDRHRGPIRPRARHRVEGVASRTHRIHTRTWGAHRHRPPRRRRRCKESTASPSKKNGGARCHQVKFGNVVTITIDRILHRRAVLTTAAAALLASTADLAASPGILTDTLERSIRCSACVATGKAPRLHPHSTPAL